MNPADLIALVERVEAATGRSRALDADVYEALGYAVKRQPELLPERSHSFTVAWKYLRDGRWYAMLDLTASLDAVRALAAEKLPGWGWKVEVEFAGEGGAVASLFDELTCDGSGATPALALLAALLKALTSQAASAAGQDVGAPAQPQATEADRGR